MHILHRQHHAFSDTERDPHSPAFFRDVFRMMLHTKRRYDAYAYRREEPEARFAGGYPRWFEIDPTWQVMRILAKTRVIEIATPQRAVVRGPATATAP